MKRALLLIGTFLIVMLMIAATSAFADKGYTVRASYYDPDNAEPGFSFGASFGGSFNDVVMLGIGTDFYYKNYTRSTEVATGVVNGIPTTISTTQFQYSTLIFPIMAELNVRIPIVWKVAAFGHGGIGFEFMRTKMQDYYDNSIEDKRWYAGFAWIAGAGVAFELGNDTDIYVEGFYKHSEVKRNLDEFSEGMPVFEQVDLSGVGIRLGIALYI